MKDNHLGINFEAFADATSSCQIEQLTLENQGDRLSLYGSLQITCDQQGLHYAQALQQVLAEAIAYLHKQPLPEKIQCKPTSEAVDNPFL